VCVCVSARERALTPAATMPGDDEYDFLFKGKNTFVCLHPRSH
jgi:hypothetical protein